MNFSLYTYLIVVFMIVMIMPCNGDITTIRPGGTVFLGEEGLDITASGIGDGDQIGWWAPGSMISSEPTDVVTISSPDSFYVSPSSFSGKEGLWYTWPGKNPVFNVKTPQISVRVYDEGSDFDATGKWIPRGDSVSFRISSNVYEANSRGGTTGQTDIVLTSPEGARYSSVSGPSGQFSLEGIPLTSSLTSTGPVWNTGGVTVGTWTVRAELSMNHIKDNLPDIGEGISDTVEVLIQNGNPLIKSDVAIEVGDTSSDNSNPENTNVNTPVPTVTTSIITPVLTQLYPVQTKKDTNIPTPIMTYSPVDTPITKSETQIPNTTVPTPEPTKSSAGLLTVIFGLLIIILVRRS